ncbi:hypothetical protein H3N56_09140 [Cetobacterium sp. 2A]|uniref:tetratricopeptide repeat protein n=1 Tax=Cetobacterium sp. 2A TaxID=2754723 RepID=UPI00163CC6A4|nr:hypothetical protein [Cetobacterium sp. 2A]
MKKWGIIFLGFLIFQGCSNQDIKKTSLEKEEYYILRGMSFYHKGNVTEALKNYEKANSINKRNIIVLRELALVQYELGDSKESIKNYKKVLELDKHDEIALKNLGIIMFSQGNYFESEKYLKSVEKNLHGTQTLKALGLIMYKKGNIQEAQNYLKRSITMNNIYDEEMFVVYSQILFDKKEKEALYYFLKNEYNKYLTDKNFNLFYARVLGEKLDAWEKSELILKKYIIETEATDEIYLMLGYIYYEMGLYSQSSLMLKLISNSNIDNKDYIILQKKLSEIRELNY